MSVETPCAPMVDPARIRASYRHCEQVARAQARNFYFSFLTLPADRKAAMCAIYAFMRYSDDVSDGGGQGLARLEAMRAWRQALERALAGEYGENPILPAFHDTVRRYCIPPRYFHELIDGTEMDLTKSRYATWEELYQYCYRVAAVVGFVCLHVWGFDPAEGRALQYAEACGLAFQLTNILRDVKEDAERGRIYLPQEDLRRFGVTEPELLRGVMTERVRALIGFEVERARRFYAQAERLLPLVHPVGRPTLRIMTGIYRGILQDIERHRYDVYSRRARVSLMRKLAIVAGAWFADGWRRNERLRA